MYQAAGALTGFKKQPNNSKPYGIALLRESLEDRGKEANLKNLIWKPFNSSRPYIIVTTEILTKLKAHLIDMVIVGRQTTLTHCDIYKLLHEKFSGSGNYLVREVEGTGRAGFSVNRCTSETDGFLPDVFKLAEPTPGAENKCDFDPSAKSVPLFAKSFPNASGHPAR